ncbi:MAG: HAMP domain-containing histidine kinase [Actinomycetota bacterium]|nr:HAMP domain-containing histidine kinase [Actinomycetota bacterium]
MAFELAQVVAEFPLAASFAIAGGISVVREGRRRSSLNEAVHELRRPLQVLALSLPADSSEPAGVDSSLRLVAAAVERLEREINGDGRGLTMSAPFALGPLVEAAVERWQVRARSENRSLSLCLEASEVLLHGDETELSQAVDNMINNAFEHGGGEVTVKVREEGGSLRVAVRDCGRPAPASPRENRVGPWARISGRTRHGHGLKVVRRVAERHGGSFQLRRSAGGTEAQLELLPTGVER